MTTQVKQDLQHLESGQIPGAGHCGTGHLIGLRPVLRSLALAGQGLSPGLLPATQGLTLSFTWPELLSRRFRRYSSRHWLLPRDSWEISKSHLG